MDERLISKSRKLGTYSTDEMDEFNSLFEQETLFRHSRMLGHLSGLGIQPYLIVDENGRLCP